MDTIVDALKKLYVALGGDADTVADITLTTDMINALCGVVPASGNVLPEVTTADNGKIMKVVDGAWELAEDATE